jgi:hypothetical protein
MGMIIFDIPDAATLDEVVFLPVKARWQRCQIFKEGLDRDANRVFVNIELVLALLDSTILGDLCLDKKERMMHMHHKILCPLDIFIRCVKHRIKTSPRSLGFFRCFLRSDPARSVSVPA